MAELTTSRLSTDFRTAAQQERQALGERIAQLRREVAELRDRADALEQDAVVSERILRNLEDVLGVASQLRLDLPDGELGGKRLREVAVDVLLEHRGPGQPVHYVEWFELVRAAGHRVAGKDPTATFLAQINRHPDIERVGKKTGRYQVMAGASNGDRRPRRHDRSGT